jgi:hypothetical protein
MRRRTLMGLLAAAVIGLLMAACSTGDASASRELTDKDRATLEGLAIEVHRTATCGCCEEYETYLRGFGVTVSVVVHDDIAAFKEDRGVPPSVWSCHTSLVDGYVVEGHVPVEAIVDLLAARPSVDGIGLSGMPPGSPGMGGERVGPWEVQTIDAGDLGLFGRY